MMSFLKRPPCIAANKKSQEYGDLLKPYANNQSNKVLEKELNLQTQSSFFGKR
jgi:hypothetical protein